MELDSIEAAERLTEVFAFSRSPVAVTFTNEEVELDSPRIWLCRALKEASEGTSFLIDPERSACPGGSWHCGLTGPPSGAARRGLQQFLTRGEKLTASIVTFQRMMGLTEPPPTGMADGILMTPLKDSPLRPDLVVFLCSAAQACRLLTLDYYWDGVPQRIDMAGSLCHSAIAYPAVTGRTNVTFGDWTARRMQKYPDDVVFVTIPYERVHNLVSAIPECSAGTADVEMPEALRELMERGEL